MSKKTSAPITFATLQAVMNHLGYGMVRKSADDKGDPAVVHWAQDPDNRTALEKLGKDAPKEVVTLMPDFTADGLSELVYDRDYVTDLFGHITKDAKVSGTEILANLRDWGRPEPVHVAQKSRRTGG
jgi:hypothetical protein